MTSTIRFVPFSGNAEDWPAFSIQFLSVVRRNKHADGVKYHFLAAHENTPVVAGVEPASELLRDDLDDEAKAAQVEVYTLLMLASSDPGWLNLFSSIDPSDLPVHCGAIAWSRAQAEYAPRTPSSRASLQASLYDASLHSDESASDLLKRVLTLRDRFVSVGGAMSDSAVCSLVLSKLGSPYAAVRTALSITGNSEDLTALRSALRDSTSDIERERQAAATASDSPPAAAFLAARSPPAGARGKVCWQCGGPDHLKSESRAADWAPCRGYCASVGKQFQPPRPPRQPVAAAAVAVESAPPSGVPAVPFGFAMMARAAPCPPSTGLPADAWLVDTGANTFLSSDPADSHLAPAINEPPLFFHGLGLSAPSSGLGSIRIPSEHGPPEVYSPRVQFVPDMASTGVTRLFSVRQAVRDGWSFEFGPAGGVAVTPGRTLVDLVCVEDCYFLVPAPAVNESRAHYSYTRHTPEKNLWHVRLCHLGVHSMDKLLRASYVSGLTYRPGDVDSFCNSCALAKARAAPVSRELSPRASQCCAKLTWDLFGPISVPTHSGELYVSALTDSCSSIVLSDLVRLKSDAPQASLDRLFSTAARWGHTVIRIRVDNDSVLLSRATRERLASRDVTLESTGADQHHRIGLSERQWGTLWGMAQSMLQYSGLNSHFWGFAIQTAVYTRNRCFLDAVVGVPFHIFTGQPVDLSHLRVFGCPAYAHVDASRRTKLQSRSIRGVFVGYAADGTSYLIFNPATRRVVQSASVQFDESWRESVNRLPLPRLLSPSSDSDDDADAAVPAAPAGPVEPQAPAEPVEPVSARLRSATTPPEPVPTPALPAPTPPPPSTVPRSGPVTRLRASTPLAAGSVPFPPLTVSDVGGSSSPSAPAVGAPSDAAEPSPPPPTAPVSRPSRSAAQPPDYRRLHRGYMAVAPSDRRPLPVAIPRGVRQAAVSPEHAEWRAAMAKEVGSVRAQQVLGPLQWPPPGANVIPTHVVFDLKYHKDGSIARYKARVVAGGDRQVEGVDFAEVFAPTVRMTSLRVFASVVCSLGGAAHQFDVVTAFLNADVEEEVYVRPLPVFPPAEGQEEHADPLPTPGMVHRLLKSLYGLRQSPRNWYFLVTRVMAQLGFKQSEVDPGVYCRFDDKGQLFMLLVIYVDDIIAASEGETWVIPLHQSLQQHFEVNHLGPASWMLGMAWEQDLQAGQLTLHQEKYVNDMLERYNLTDCNPAPTPLALGFKVDADSPLLPSAVSYASLIGSLNYAAVCTRPDIAYAVSQLSRVMAKPTQHHWAAAKRVLRYLAGSKKKGITYSQEEQPELRNQLQGHVDTSFATAEDSRSAGGCTFSLNGATVCFHAFVIGRIALSTAEAEYYGLAVACQDCIFLRELLNSMGLPQDGPTLINEDNQACITLANNPITQKRTRHIQVKFHFVRQLVLEGLITLKYCPSSEMWADVFTKPLSPPQHNYLTKCIMNSTE